MKLSEFKVEQLREGDIVFFRGNDFIAKSIIEAQSVYTKDKYNVDSQWSHIGFVGSDKNFYESTVKINLINDENYIKIFGKKIKIKIPKLKYIYGIYISSLENRFKNIQENYVKLGIQRLKINKKDWIDKITSHAKLLHNLNIKYGGIELFGTLYAILKYKITKNEKVFKEENIFNDQSVYCVAFVSDCFKKGCGIDYTDPQIHSSVLVVDEAWLNCQQKVIETIEYIS